MIFDSKICSKWTTILSLGIVGMTRVLPCQRNNLYGNNAILHVYDYELRWHTILWRMLAAFTPWKRVHILAQTDGLVKALERDNHFLMLVFTEITSNKESSVF